MKLKLTRADTFLKLACSPGKLTLPFFCKFHYIIKHVPVAAYNVAMPFLSFHGGKRLIGLKISQPLNREHLCIFCFNDTKELQQLARACAWCVDKRSLTLGRNLERGEPYNNKRIMNVNFMYSRGLHPFHVRPQKLAP